MVRVSIYKNQHGDFIGVNCHGHAGYAKSGQDIVCAAVSVLIINTINSIEQFTKDRIHYLVDDKETIIDFKLIDEAGSESLLLVKSLVLGLSSIARDYTKFIKIDF